MTTNMSLKLAAGDQFPAIDVTQLDGQTCTLGQPNHGASWHMVVIYRGRHCPLCTKYLNALAEVRDELLEIGVDVIAVTADSLEQATEHAERLSLNFPRAYGLSLEQMQRLGLYISHPRSEQETDHPFPEPGLFVINEDGNVHVVDYSNNPFVRPEIRTLVNGLKWIRDPDNNYPIRGTFKE